MASSSLHCRRNSIDIPPAIADAVRLKDELIKLYERDQPQLQQCIKKLHDIIKTFEKDFRGSTEGSRKAGVAGIIGGTAVLSGIGIGIGIALAPLTFGMSAFIAAGAGIGAGIGAAVGGAGTVTLVAAGIKSNKHSSEKENQMKILRKAIEAELKEFQDKINPMDKKMRDLHEHTEKILEDVKKLEEGANDLSKYFNSRNIRPEDLAELNKQMSADMLLLTSIAKIYDGFSLVLDMISVRENSKAVGDMDKLAEKPIDEEIDESKIRSKAGKFIVEIRKLINQLQNIIDELGKTKDKLSKF